MSQIHHSNTHLDFDDVVTSPIHLAFVTACMIAGFIIPIVMGEPLGASIVGMIIGLVVGAIGPYVLAVVACFGALWLIHIALFELVQLLS